MERTRVALIYVLLLLPLARPSLVCIKPTNDKSGQMCAYQWNSGKTSKAINELKGELNRLRQQMEDLQTSNRELRRSAIGIVNGWYAPLNGYEYKVTPNTQSWNESRVICQGWGGDLAVHGIQTLDSRLNLIRALSLTTAFWIGAHDKGNIKTWKWVNGDNATYEQIIWGPGEPNNYGNTDNCLEIIVSGNNERRSNDRSCSDQSKGLCEKTI